ncbi:hypothetical protein QAD02_023122 [Eretmocerus hayati]|uniref:Uncharacterized protein n=1 Tax=Eretmocerus hayati TaxID=131215 RepID=A0ACC2PWK5_9HYME|nr:hypothetical protein QAD02_023122 [Eretmocerus hayati]
MRRQYAPNPSWTGFHRLQQDTPKGGKKTVGARCIPCGRVLSGHSNANLDDHREHTCPEGPMKPRPKKSDRVALGELSTNSQVPHSKQATGRPPASLVATTISSTTGESTHHATTEQTGLTPLAPLMSTAPSPRASNSTQRNPTTMHSGDQEEQNILGLHICIKLCLKFEFLEKIQSVKFIHSLNKNYNVPSAKQFRTDILGKAIALMTKQIHSYDFSDLMVIALRVRENRHEIVSLMLTTDSKSFVDLENAELGPTKDLRYVFIHGCEYDQIEDFDATVQSFCKKSLEKVLDNFGIFIKYIMYDGIIGAPSKGSFQNHVYTTFNSTLDILRKLRGFDASKFEGLKESNDYQIYCNELQTLVNKLNKNPLYTLSESVEDIFCLMQSKVLDINSDAMSNIEACLNPVMLAANFLDPRFRGRKFRGGYPTLMANLESYFDNCGIGTGQIHLGKYIRETDYFVLKLKDFEEKNIDVTNFWESVGRKSESLSKFGLRMTSMPASGRRVSFRDILHIINTIGFEVNDNTKRLVAFILMD